MNGLNEELVALRREVVESQEICGHYDAEVEQQKEHYERLLAGQEEQLHENQQVIEQLECLLNDEKHSKDALADKLSRVAAEHHDVAIKHQNLKFKVNAFKQRTQRNIARQFDQLKQALTDIRLTLANYLKLAQSECKLSLDRDLKRVVHLLDSKLNQLHHDKTSTSMQLTQDMQAQLDRFKHHFTHSEQQLKDHYANQIADYQATVQQLNNQIATLHSEVESLSLLHADVHQLKKQLAQEVTEKEQMYLIHNEKIYELQSQYQNQLNLLNSKVNSLTNELYINPILINPAISARRTTKRN